MRGDIALLRRSTKAVNAAISTVTGPPAPAVCPVFGEEGDCDVLGPGDDVLGPGDDVLGPGDDVLGPGESPGGEQDEDCKRDEDCSLEYFDVVTIVGVRVELSSS